MKDENVKSKYTLKDDIVFKIFFGKPGNEKFLKSFLETLLNVKINKIEVMQEASLKQLRLKEKNGRLDIKATLNNSEIVNIEMQMTDYHNIDKRSVYYGSRLISEQLERGNYYTDIKPVILINILNFNFLDVPEYHTETITVSKEHRDYEIIKDVKYHFIELPKFREQKPELSNELECWLALIDYENRELVNMAEQKSPIVKEAKEEFEEILSEGVLKEIQEYEETASYEIASYCHYVEMETRKKMKDEVHDEVKNELKDEVRNEIQEETRTEEKRKIAIEMLNNGLDINIIQKVTKLSLDEIQELQKACKNKI